MSRRVLLMLVDAASIVAFVHIAVYALTGYSPIPWPPCQFRGPMTGACFDETFPRQFAVVVTHVVPWIFSFGLRVW